MTDPAVYTGKAEVRAGILVTGTEVLTGIITDRNGPWLSEQLRDLGVDAAMIQIVGDRPQDLRDALAYMHGQGVRLVITSGGLGPTADDLTAELVGEFCGRKMILDEPLEQRIEAIVKGIRIRYPGADVDALREANRKQAIVPEGATILPPRGTAPGLVVAPVSGGGPTVVVLPGPPGELQAMWTDAVADPGFQAAIRGATEYRREIVRLFGMPEAAIAETLRAAADAGLDLSRLEITTCLRRGEIEVSTRFEPAAAADYEALVEFVAARHPQELFARAGETIDDQVAALLAGETIATAESCTGGLLAARLTDRPGSSAYVLGGVVAYSNEVKIEFADVPEELIATYGAVSVEVARALADGARSRFGASVGVGITGIAGPDGGTPEKPVGSVCFSVTYGRGAAERALTRSPRLPGNRVGIRDRASTTAMHLIARLLQGESD